LADLREVGLELITFRLGDGACRDVVRLVVAVNEAFAADVPAGTHPFVAPRGSILGAFSGKVVFPDFALFHQEFGDGRGVLDDAVFIAVSLLPLFALFVALAVLVFGARGRDRGILGRWFDEVGRKSNVEGAVHNHFEDFDETNEMVVDHRAVLVFFAFPKPTLDVNLHRVKDLGGEVAVDGDSALEDDFLGQNRRGEQFTAFGESAAHAKKDSSYAWIK
jgi:hypothetical protein